MFLHTRQIGRATCQVLPTLNTAQHDSTKEAPMQLCQGWLPSDPVIRLNRRSSAGHPPQGVTKHLKVITEGVQQARQCLQQAQRKQTTTVNKHRRAASFMTGHQVYLSKASNPTRKDSRSVVYHGYPKPEHVSVSLIKKDLKDEYKMFCAAYERETDRVTDRLQASYKQPSEAFSQRCWLRGIRSVLFKMLTAKERLKHTALWPQLEQAFTRGSKAQFHPSHPFVEGARPHD
eukprot:352629-Chlamydomonas_euryale.AAC.4